MVDHTFVFTPAVQKMRELRQGGELGELYYYDSVRINLGIFQHDVNVLWDLAVHDLSIMDFVVDRQPVAVSATGLSHVSGQPENIAYMTMFFEDNLIAHVHANWLAPVKVRRTLLGGSRRMVMFDDLEASEKIKVYDRGISVNSSPEKKYQMLVGYRAGDMWAPQLAIREALSAEAAHFVDCVTTAARPVTDGAAGLRVVHLLEAASQSMRAQGALVSIRAGVPL
jgi:predicted dehydrogenase